MPAEGRNDATESRNGVEGETARIAPVDANAAHPRLMKLLHRSGVDVGMKHGNAAEDVGRLVQRVEERAVVRAVDAGLNEHAARDAHVGEKAKIIPRSEIVRLVAMSIGKRVFRAEDVRMRVAGALR